MVPPETLSPLAERVERVLADHDYAVSATIEAIDAAVPGTGGLFDPNTSAAELSDALDQLDTADSNTGGGQGTAPTAAETETFVLYVDGAARGNPGPAGAGAVIMERDGATLRRLGRPVGSRTDNNTAEYDALALGLVQLLSRYRPRALEVRIDSRTVIDDVWAEGGTGDAPAEEFRAYHRVVTECLSRIPNHGWRHLADDDPNPADALATVGADIAALGPGY